MSIVNKLKFKKLIAVVATAISICTLSTISVSASSTINGRDVSEFNTDINKAQYETKDESGSKVKLFTVENNKITFDSATFDSLTPDEQERAMKELSESLQESSMTTESKQAVMEEVRASSYKAGSMMIPVIFEDTQADLFSAFKVFQPFASGPLSFILGIGVIIIIVLLMGSTVLDLVYIGVPVMRNYMTTKTEQSTGNAMNKPWGITNDAFSAINETEATLQGGDGKYKNAYVIYFKRRIFTYIILAICILYLLSGEIVGFISWLLNLVSGVI